MWTLRLRTHASPSIRRGLGALVSGLAGSCAWSFSEWRRLHAPAELAAEEGLPSPPEASRFQAVRLEGFLTEAEISDLLALGAEVRESGVATLHRTGTSALSVVHSRETVSSPPESRWQTTYLHANQQFQNRLGPLREKLRSAALSVDEDSWGICRKASENFAQVSGERPVQSEPLPSSPFSSGWAELITVRTAELHSVTAGGSLPQRDHYDAGSCVTVDIMLSRPGVDFLGGDLELTPATEAMPFRRGDALIFPSHKYHSVQPVLSGLRQVFVLELWVGRERSCPHHCHLHWGPCSEGQRSWEQQLGRLIRAVFTDEPVNPW